MDNPNRDRINDFMDELKSLIKKYDMAVYADKESPRDVLNIVDYINNEQAYLSLSEVNSTP